MLRCIGTRHTLVFSIPLIATAQLRCTLQRKNKQRGDVTVSCSDTSIWFTYLVSHYGIHRCDMCELVMG